MKAFIYLACAAFVLPSPNAMSQSPKKSAENWMKAAPPVPEFVPPASQAEWAPRREAIRQQLRQLLGKLPVHTQVPKVTTLSREQGPGYTLEKFQFDNGAGAIVPGYIFLPEEVEGKAPAILYCHWHGGQYDVGKAEMLGTNATPVAAGPDLARRGFVVLGIDAYCFGERNGQGPGGLAEKGSSGEMTASKFQLWYGRTLWGMIVRDDILALNYLCSRPEVDAARIGVTGISMGATRTWWLMAMDDRPKTGVAVACLTRYQNLIEHGALKAHGIYYFVPGMLSHFDTEAVVALAAPRPMLFMTGDQDSGSPADGIREIEAKVRSIYRLQAKEGEFESKIYPGVGHVYLPEMWSNTVAWMERRLNPR